MLLVVIDTARADKFGCLGDTRGLTPAIDALAQSGAVFEQASANAPWTLPSTASLLTSQHPPEHGAGGYVDLRPPEQGGQGVAFRRLPQAALTLAEVLAERGWRTGAVVNVDFLDRDFGLTQGVQDLDARWYGTNREVRSATETTDKALEWIEEQDGAPFFLLAHYFDAHAVYDPPNEFRARFANPVDRSNSNFVFGTRAHMNQLRGGRLELDPNLIERAERLYEAELAYIDQQVGRLLDGLRAAGLMDNTLVVLTADHGEEFLEHGGFEHGHTLYEELLHVPLIFSWPGHVPAGVRVNDPQGLVDVAPTICDYMELDAPDVFMGSSLRAGLEGATFASGPILAHGNFWGEPLTSLRSGPWKMIQTPLADGSLQSELYNLIGDPQETLDLAELRPLILERMQLELQVTRARFQAKAHGREVELDEETRRRLDALGYMGEGERPASGDSQ